MAEWTIHRIYESVPAEELAKLDASGTAADNIHWYWGSVAADWISRGMPKMLVYAAIGKRVGRAASTIAQCYYTFISFGRDETDERVPYSVYNHARQWHEPDEVIQYYLDNRCSVDEIETVFRISEPDEEREQFAKTGLPRMFVGVWRAMVGLPAEKRERAIALLREVLEVIEWQK